MMRVVVYVVAAVAAVVWADSAHAQCAMCVTALEQNGGAWATRFNHGILFLLGTPYLVFLTIGTYWYLKRKRLEALSAETTE